MHKVLVFRVSDVNPVRTLMWDISEKYLRENAYTDLFTLLDKELEMFDAPFLDSAMYSLLPQARNGNPSAAEALIRYAPHTQNLLEEIVLERPFAPRLRDTIRRETVQVPSPEVDDIPDLPF